VIRKDVLPRFSVSANATIAPLGAGLINETYLLSSADARYVLQRVNPLFPPSIHDNIRAVTSALIDAGLVTPRLIPTNDGQLYLTLPSPNGGSANSVWRLLTHIEGVSFEIVADPDQARAAGELIARFHTVMDNVAHSFKGLRSGVHDTPKHLAHLRAMTTQHAGHRLFADVAPLASAILEAAQTLPTLPTLPPRICHGDLKFNNLLFAGTAPSDRARAVCLIDLDTVGPMPLAFELGDAWRSWCNRAGENNVHADLDLDLFAASLDGYRAGLSRALSEDQGRALLLGPDWVSLELSARFAGDALAESYFGWDSQRFPGRGEHNLLRARGQFSLYQALAASRSHRAGLLGI
jgi:Ser/Thr protein kinase RdoA (MazF antagonist)